jgi:DNA primase
MYQARKTITQEDKCYMVEGYTDVISCHEAGVYNVVASSGTSLTQEQVRLVKRFTPNMTILYDGDAAGIKASIRGIDLVLEEGMNVKIVLLPDGEDPDSYSKKVSNEDFLKFLKENETDFIRFKTNLLLEEAGNDPIKKAELIRDVVKSIAVIPDSITRTIYIKECSTYLEVAEPVIYNEVNKLLRQKNFKDRNEYPRIEDLPVMPQQVAVKPIQPEALSYYSEREIIRLLLRFGSYEFEKVRNKEDGNEEVISVSDFIVGEINNDGLFFDDKICGKIFSDFSFNTQQGLVTGERQFVKHEDPVISSFSAEMLADSHELSKIWKAKQTFVETEEMKLREMVSDAVLKFKSDKIKQIMKELMTQLEAAVKENNIDKVLELQKRYSMLSVALREISRKMGGRILL